MERIKRKPAKTIAYRVAKGIKLLNKEYGRSWLRRIDPEQLALEDRNSCILGQLEGDYDAGLEQLNLGSGYPYGFDNTDGNYDALNRTWRESIAKLRKLFKVK